jgi:3'(2'), 5'-bisphosphate nucleotidase
MGGGAFLHVGGGARGLHVYPVAYRARTRIAFCRWLGSARVHRARRLLGIPDAVSSGSLGLKIGLIAEGLAHCYIHTDDRTSQWDTCGPDAILREAGGSVTDIFGAPLVYNREERRNLHGVIATNGAIHSRVVEALREARDAE